MDTDGLDLTENDQVGQITGNRGANAFSIQLANGDTAIAKLPNKFHKVLWVKSKDFVVVATSGEDVSSTDTLTIKYVLSKENIKSLKKSNQWPEVFEEGKKTNNHGICTEYTRDLLPPMGDNEEQEYEEEEGEEATVAVNAMGNDEILR